MIWLTPGEGARGDFIEKGGGEGLVWCKGLIVETIAHLFWYWLCCLLMPRQNKQTLLVLL